MAENSEIGRIISTSDCIEEGVAFLTERCPQFRNVYQQSGPLQTRLREGGFSALLRAIVSQQLSVAAAASIWQRLETQNLTEEKQVLSAREETLRSCGLSGPKVRYAKALASANINYDDLQNRPDSEVIKILTAVSGIGRWTAEIYAMFSLGRANAFAAGDLALQEAARMLFELPERPSETALRTMAQEWQPWRAVAARLLWAHYRTLKTREGVN